MTRDKPRIIQIRGSSSFEFSSKPYAMSLGVGQTELTIGV